MTTKTKNIIKWSMTGVVGFIFIGSAISKLTGGADALEMAQNIGLDAATLKVIGVLELFTAVLFIIPRTGILGTLLLAAFMGGAIATHLEHGMSIAAPVAIQSFIWIVAVVRFPELKLRIINKQINK